uniref:Uncharacterized protein n=1 Tax=Arundo donax TaxID=35708 RepID=A0A0A9AWF4_ARUDO
MSPRGRRIFSRGTCGPWLLVPFQLLCCLFVYSLYVSGRGKLRLNCRRNWRRLSGC